MKGLFSLLLLLTLMVLSTHAGRNGKKEKGKGGKGGSDCAEWRYGNCVPNNGDCGAGEREGSCEDQTRKLKCKVPCNWKKQFGADCKYKFGNWGDCDTATRSRSRSGTLKKALYHAECQPTIQVTKPCAQKTRSKAKGKKGRAKEN